MDDKVYLLKDFCVSSPFHEVLDILRYGHMKIDYASKPTYPWLIDIVVVIREEPETTISRAEEGKLYSKNRGSHHHYIYALIGFSWVCRREQSARNTCHLLLTLLDNCFCLYGQGVQ